MADTTDKHMLGEKAARQLSNTTKTPPQWVGTTPRWLVQLLPWTPVEAGVYRLNRVLDSKFSVECSPEAGTKLPVAFVDYEDKPREYVLSTCTTTIQIHSRVSDLFRSPMDQTKEQLAVAIEKLKEKQEDELLNNGSYGLLNNIRAIAAFGRECTRRGVPPATVVLFGTPVLTWRGLPIVPCDKLHVNGNKTDILLMRTGEKKRGVIGLFQPGVPGEVSPSLSVRFMSMNQQGAASYLISLYCSAAVMVEDAIGSLEGVTVDHYHEYK
ncbi:MAG: hypothetical protein NT062_29300 [Proteobacteria bacterium]|nr:hypothetical protein [Pseudomonadota bacterium]